MYKAGYQTRTNSVSFYSSYHYPNKKIKEITKNNKLYVFLEYGLVIVNLKKYKLKHKDTSFYVQCIQELQEVHIISIPYSRNINDTLWHNGVILFV